MSKQEIVQCADDFMDALDHAKEKLERFSQSIGEKNEAVSEYLRAFASAVGAEGTRLAPAKTEGEQTMVDKAMQEALSQLQGSIRLWQETVEASKTGRKFMVNHQKYLAVMVFGAVKSGKSTLGNLIAGREWLTAAFDNRYQHMPATEFSTEEKGRNTGDIEQQDGRYWFKEGVTDTTGDIQYFTLSGLRWFDSPGTGALSKEGDRRNMEEMVKEYLRYVDLCIFLINSSEPGLMEDMKYMNFLNRSEQEALVVITKSDVRDEEVGDDGEFVQKWVAKSEDNRKLQEDDMCHRLADAFPELDPNKYRAISISTYLAQEALKTGDAQTFEGSHLGLLMQKIAGKAEDDVIELKTARPKRAMNVMLTEILEGGNGMPGLYPLELDVQAVQKNIDTFRASIQSRTRTITKRITREVKAKAAKEVSRMAIEVAEMGRGGGARDIAKTVFEATQSVMAPTIQREVAELIGANESLTASVQVHVAQADIRTQGLKKETRTVQHHVTRFVSEERDPSGLIENIASFFGRKYHRVHAVTETQESVIDMGTNQERVIDELMPQIEDYVAANVRDNLEKISRDYFGPQEQWVQAFQKAADELEGKLKQLQFA